MTPSMLTTAKRALLSAVMALCALHATAATPATPSNLSPGSSSSPGPEMSSGAISLRWNAVSGATSYDLGVRDVDSGRLVVDTRISAAALNVNLTPGGRYRWNLRSCNASACSAFAAPRYFTVKPAAKALSSLAVSCPTTMLENSMGSCVATARFSDNSTATVTTLANWSENSAYAAISSTGVLSAGAVPADQAVTVTAGYTYAGVTKSGTFPLAIKDVPPAKTLSTVTVLCPPTVNENTAGTCSATARFSDNSASTVTALAKWSENSAYATISSAGVLSAGAVAADQAVTVTAGYTYAGLTKVGTAALAIKNTPLSAGFALIVAKPGTGSGSVKGASIDCGAVCSASYASGASVTLTATAGTGSTFIAWGGACSGTGTCTLAMTSPQAATSTVTATFNSTNSLNELVASAALAQVSSPAGAAPRSVAKIATLFAELDPAGADKVLRGQHKTWLTDLEDGTAGTQDGARMRNAIQRYSVWKVSPPIGRESYATLRASMEADLGPVYDTTRRVALASRIVDVWDTMDLHFSQRVPGARAPTVPASDQETIDFMGVRAMCFEWVATVGLRAGAKSVSYQDSAAVPLASSHRAGMAMFWYTSSGTGAHAAIITSIEFDSHGNPAYYNIAESNYAKGWMNPGGATPWLRTITSRRIHAAVNPPSKPTEMSTSGRVVSFIAR